MKDAPPPGYRIEEMTLASDFDEYDRAAVANMRDYDVTRGEELREIMQKNLMRSWNLRDPSGTLVGNALLGLAAEYMPDTYHQYGVWIAPSERGKGLGHVMIERSVADYPTTDITVSIAPDNTASLNLCKSVGFTEFIGEEAHWHNFILRRQK